MDEATQFEWEQLEYLMSRLRSNSKYPSRMVMSCNPDYDHKIRELISWYLDEEGYPIPERDGKIRWFIQRGSDFYWADTPEELKEKFGEKARPLSFSFVSGLVYDNPPMVANNPDYVAFLESLNEVDKAQLLYGCWNARPKGSTYFERDWLVEVNGIPENTFSCRSYDLSATERSQVNKYPDFTASIMVSRDTEGYTYLSGNYCPEFYDEETQAHGRLCKRVGERDNIISKQAQHDGQDVFLVFPIDPGAAGKHQYTEMSKRFIDEGFFVKSDPIPSNKSKLTRFLPFANAAENGLVRIVKNTFDPVTYSALMKELEAFNGERSTSTRKDDYVDSLATGFNFLAAEYGNLAVAVPLPTINAPTMLSGMSSLSYF